MIKVVLIQRVCPHYRVPIFKKLAQKVDLILYYGKGQKTGAVQNAKKIEGFKAKRLFTVAFNLKWGEKEYYISWFPFLIWSLIKDKPQVVITEGTTNIINNIFIIPYCKLVKIPIIWWDGGRDIRMVKSKIRMLIEPILRLLIKSSDIFIAYGKIAKEYIMSFGIPPEKIFIAQNTIDTSYIKEEISKYNDEILRKEKERLNLQGKKIILYVGAIEKRKKIENLLIAFKKIKTQYSDVVLLIIGDGDYKKNIEDFIKTYQLRDVYLLGRITERVGLYFMLSDVVVLPGWSSLAVNQAMAYGKPVITVPYGGPEYELVEDGKTGYIVERDNIEQLSFAILRILKDDNLRKIMWSNARAKINQVANVENMIEKIYEAISKVSL